MRNILLLSLLLIVETAYAGGYQTGLQGNANQGMASTGMALTRDASSMFYNPGCLGVTDFADYTFSLGLTGAMGMTAYEAPQPSDYKTSTSLAPSSPFYFFFAKRLSKFFTLGMSAYTPFNSSIHWESDWKGKYIVTDYMIKTYYIQPTLSFNIKNKLGIGAGLVYGIGKFGYNFAIPGRYGQVDNGTAELTATSAKATNLGVNAGIFLHICKRIKVGASFRSPLKMDFNEGDVKNTTASSLTDSFPNTSFKTSVPMPAVVGLGFAFTITPKLILSLDGEYYFWNVNKKLEINFAETTTLQRDILFLNDFVNTFSAKLGGEYAFSKKLALRAGAFFDQSPIKKDHVTPLLPDADKIGITLGAGYSPLENLSFDISVQYVNIFSRSARYKYPDGNYFEGTYSTTGIYIGLGLAYKM